MQTLNVSICLTIVIGLLTAGCGPKYPNEKQVFKVKGIITVDGAPVPEIQVALHPVTTVKDDQLPTIMRRPPGNMPQPGFDPRNLTPEQKRRLRNAMRNGQILPVRPPANQPPY